MSIPKAGVSSPVLRTALSLAIALVSPGFAACEAAAQTAAMPVGNSGGMPVTGSAGASARSYRLGTAVPSQVLTVSPSIIPSLVAAPAPVIAPGALIHAAPAETSDLSLQAAGLEAVLPEHVRGVGAVVPVSEILPSLVQGAPPALTASRADVRGQEGSLSLLTESVPAPSGRKTDVEASGWDLERLFDGKARGRSMIESGAAAVLVSGLPLMSPAPGLGKPTLEGAPEARTPRPAKPAKPAKPRGLSDAVIAVLAAAFILAVPILAAALGVSMSTLALVQPVATVFTTVAGSVYGLVTSLRKEGGPPTAGEVVSAVVRYGVLGGAGMFFLLDLSQVLLLGKVASAISPLPAALATATLGQTAFQGKFADAGTSSADRIMSVFPAAAAALGLSVATRLPAVLMATLAVNAMAVTGLAAALFAALYRPGVSPAQGPASMARGFVLQALMSGLALAVANPYLAAAFLGLAAYGFLDVLSAAARELFSRLPPSLRGLLRRD